MVIREEGRVADKHQFATHLRLDAFADQCLEICTLQYLSLHLLGFQDHRS
ncbi:hypothetical protein SDC9_151131 [bioreactor metagenome]|uniref:Uncharacterized protein n=1 Tax=bioreactor metagenome TaxID=1076179 RepID=A0A645ER19_9ZZZZ